MTTNIDNLIIRHYAGSRAYGTELPSSDVDFRGIFCANKEQILTPFNRVKEVVVLEEEDTKYFELSDFMDKYLGCNPNIIETLWVDDKAIVEKEPVYDYLRSNAAALLSKKVAHTFTGYAISQMKRIKGHNKWINKPQPKDAPVRADFLRMVHNFREEQIFSNNWKVDDWNKDRLLIPYGNDIYGVIQDPGRYLLNKDGSLKKYEFDELPLLLKKAAPEFIVKLCETEYKAAQEMHKNYWKWKRDRNKKRSELEEKFGYDTKHAMHVVRLMRMGQEILKDGIVRVRRDDAQELLDIRAGKWSYEEILQFAEDADDNIKVLMKSSDLPNKPNVELATKVLMEAQEFIWTN